MGILGYIASKAAVGAAKKVGEYAFYRTGTAVMNDIEKKHSPEAIAKASEMKCKLFIKKKMGVFVKKFYVYDELNNKKYKVQWEGFSCIRLYNNEDNEMASVNVSKDLFDKWPTYYVYLGNRKLGVIEKSKTMKPILDVKFNGWRVQGNFLRYQFDVFDKEENLILKVNEAFSNVDTYVIEYNNITNEMMGIIILMVIELMKGRN